MSVPSSNLQMWEGRVLGKVAGEMVEEVVAAKDLVEVPEMAMVVDLYR